MNKQVYEDDPWRDIPYEEAKAIEGHKPPVAINALSLVATVIEIALKHTQQISTKTEVNHE